MKKFTVFILATVFAFVAVAQYTPVTEESAGTVSGSLVATGTGYIASTAQADTNATTTVTAYTPQFVGQVLVGGAGTGTNAVWVSKGVTTNDWVEVGTVVPD